jgi:hypothetical protein
VRLPWQSASSAPLEHELERPRIELPGQPPLNVQVRLPGGERVHARLTERDGDELVVLLMVPSSRALTPERLRDAVVEASGPRGIVRLTGEVTLEDRDTLRFRDVHPLDVVQRRENVRVTTERPVLLLRGRDLSPVETTTIDISGGGMMIRGGSHLKSGDPVRFVLTTSPERAPIEGGGTVVRKLARGKCAISFTDISEGDERRLVRFLFEVQREERQRGLITEGADG